MRAITQIIDKDREFDDITVISLEPASKEPKEIPIHDLTKEELLLIARTYYSCMKELKTEMRGVIAHVTGLDSDDKK
jgi:hypothetical protein